MSREVHVRFWESLEGRFLWVTRLDYTLKVVVPSIEAYDTVYRKMIEQVDIYNVSSSFAMEKLKNTTALPLDYAGRA